jgi:2-oxo-3-hexenedioate decarboxylase
MTHVDGLATELLDALDHARSLTPFTDRDPAFSVDAAYRVRAEVTRRRRARGETPIGRKLGFTNTATWVSFGLTAPIWAPVYDTTVTFLKRATATISVARFCEPRLEPEVVLHFQSSPPVGADETELIRHLDWIALGFEVVQSHFPGWRFRTADAIAAFGVHAHLIVGPPVAVTAIADPIWALQGFTITLLLDGVPREYGGGAQVLGSPLLATLEMLDSLAGQPDAEPIAPGEIVTTGTLTAAVPVRPGQVWSATVSGIDLAGLQLEMH